MVATRRAGATPASHSLSGTRPVMLATFNVPFAAEAETIAVDAAAETGQPLLVVNVAATPILPVSMSLGYEYLETGELGDALRRPAELAASLGLAVELLRVATPRPVEALLQLVAERSPGLLVVGSERAALGRRRYARAAKRIRALTTCLVWLPE